MLTSDPAAEFLFDLAWPNLFEPARSDSWLNWRCKACTEIVPAWERQEHYTDHRRAHSRAFERAQEKARKERLKNLAKARAARGRKAAA